MKMVRRTIFNRLKSKKMSQSQSKMPLPRKLLKRKPFNLQLKTKLPKSLSKKPKPLIRTPRRQLKKLNQRSKHPSK